MKSSGPRPRVLFLQHAVYPYREPVFEALGRDMDLTVLFCIAAKKFRRWDTDKMLRATAFRARVLPALRIGRLVINHGLAAEVWQKRYDVIVIGPVDFLTVAQVAIAIVVARLLGISVVGCEEFFPTSWYMRRRPLVARLAIRTRRWVHRRCHAFIAWNENAHQFLLGSGVRPDRIFVGPHYYPPVRFEGSVRPPFEGRPFFLTISYLLERKGIDILLDAFRCVDGEVLLAIAGKGECETKLREAAADDERIVFLGHLGEREKQPYLRHAYALVLPTLWDAWGLVVNEALYAGTPVITTDAAGCAAAVGEAGIVVSSGDASALAAALRGLLRSPEEQSKMAAATVATAAQWSLEAMTEPARKAILEGFAERARKGRVAVPT